MFSLKTDTALIALLDLQTYCTEHNVDFDVQDITDELIKRLRRYDTRRMLSFPPIPLLPL